MKYQNEADFWAGIKLEEGDAIRRVYNIAYRPVEHYVTSNNGDADAAQDLFQEGVLALMRFAKKEGFVPNVKVSTVMFTICKRRWLNKLRDGKREVLMEEFPESIAGDLTLPEELPDIKDSEKYRSVVAAMKELGEPCNEMILLKNYYQISRDDIALRMNYSSAFVGVKLHRCMNLLKKLIEKQ